MGNKKKKNKEDHEKFRKAKINRENGLNLNYDKKELDKYIPHLMEEVENKKQVLKIDSIDYDVESPKIASNKEKDNSIPEVLTNPTAIDFIRRCSTKSEAIEILDYLVEKEELSKENYLKIKEKIEKKNGLKTLIDENGGFKKPGYYFRKYYLKSTDKKANHNKKPLD
jgi:hypothetical protein